MAIGWICVWLLGGYVYGYWVDMCMAIGHRFSEMGSRAHGVWCGV